MQFFGNVNVNLKLLLCLIYLIYSMCAVSLQEQKTCLIQVAEILSVIFSADRNDFQ